MVISAMIVAAIGLLVALVVTFIVVMETCPQSVICGMLGWVSVISGMLCIVDIMAFPFV